MAYDSSWIAPTAKNIADIFGLDPAAAAKQRSAQSDAELNAAKIQNLNEDTKNKPLEGEHLRSQTEHQRALAGKTKEETTGLSMKNTGLRQLSESLARTITDWNNLTPEEQAIARDRYKAAEGYVLATGGGGNIQSSDLSALVATQGFNPKPTQEQLTTAGQYRGYSKAFPGAASDTSPQDLVAENKLSAEISSHIQDVSGTMHPKVKDYLLKATRANLKPGVDVQAAYREALAGLFGQHPVKFKDKKFFGEELYPVDPTGADIQIPGSTVAGAISGAGAPPASGVRSPATQPVAPAAPPSNAQPTAPAITPPAARAPARRPVNLPPGIPPPEQRIPGQTRIVGQDGSAYVWDGQAWAKE